MAQGRLRRVLVAFTVAQALGGAGLPVVAEEIEDPAALRQPIGSSEQASVKQKLPSAEVVRRNRKIAINVAKVLWLDRAAMADPAILEAITEHKAAAKVLARHRHIGRLAAIDHYLCRRITRWPSAAKVLVKNKQADLVIDHDPQGIYSAIARNPRLANKLAKHLMFNQMIAENPELGKVISRHMK